MASKPSEVDLQLGERYEQAAADLLVERYIGVILPEESYARSVKRGKTSHIDMAIEVDGAARLLLEVKYRRLESTAFETTAVHWLKYVSARQLRRALGLRTACLVVFLDRAGIFWLDERPDGKQFIARADREGEGCDHAMYAHSRITWIEGFREALDAITGE